jgi:hypothetical protein
MTRPVKSPCPDCGAPMRTSLDPNSVGFDWIAMCTRPSCEHYEQWRPFTPPER